MATKTGLCAGAGDVETGVTVNPLKVSVIGIPTTQIVDVNGNAVGVTGGALNVTAGSAGATSALGRSTLPTVSSSGAVVSILADRYGRLYRIAPILTNASSAGTAITTNTNTQIVAAPSSGNHLRIHRLWAQNSSATATWCYWGNGSGVKTIPFYLAQYQPMMMNLGGSWELSTVTALYLNTATTAANIEWYVEYETLAD